MNLTINFSDGNILRIKNPDIFPNLGEVVHNEKDKLYRYYVTKKDIYYNIEFGSNVIISADKPELK